MKVYTHYLRKNDIVYRWRTIIQIGESWDVCGTVFMKNPGASNNIKADSSPIDNNSLLEHLREFDDTSNMISNDWYEFSIDNTMSCVIRLFEAYYKKPLNGVIQLFNLFNIRDANLGRALDKCKGDVINKIVYTTDDDIKHIVSPVYIGWGNLWNKKEHRENAKRIFDEVIKHTHYLCDDIKKNKYYHPLYLMNYGKNRDNCKTELTRFITHRE